MGFTCISCRLEVLKKCNYQPGVFAVECSIFHLSGSVLGHLVELKDYDDVLSNRLFDGTVVSIIDGIGKHLFTGLLTVMPGTSDEHSILFVEADLVLCDVLFLFTGTAFYGFNSY